MRVYKVRDVCERVSIETDDLNYAPSWLSYLSGARDDLRFRLDVKLASCAKKVDHFLSGHFFNLVIPQVQMDSRANEGRMNGFQGAL